MSVILNRLRHLKIKTCDDFCPLCPILRDSGVRQFARLTQTRRALTCDVIALYVKKIDLEGRYSDNENIFAKYRVWKDDKVTQNGHVLNLYYTRTGSGPYV